MVSGLRVVFNSNYPPLFEPHSVAVDKTWALSFWSRSPVLTFDPSTSPFRFFSTARFRLVKFSGFAPELVPPFYFDAGGSLFSTFPVVLAIGNSFFLFAPLAIPGLSLFAGCLKNVGPDRGRRSGL